MNKKKILKAIDKWNCFGYFGYGQGRAVAEFGVDEIGNESVCHKVCPKAEQCRGLHYVAMDKRFPAISEIVKKTAVLARQTGLPIVPSVTSAMITAAKMNNPEALRIQEGLKKYQVSSMTDHYVYGQFENLENGLEKRSPDTAPVLLLPSAKITGKLV